jgi:hypothetical protein
MRQNPGGGAQRDRETDLDQLLSFEHRRESNRGHVGGTIVSAARPG